jgi:hypothetical protein
MYWNAVNVSVNILGFSPQYHISLVWVLQTNPDVNGCTEYIQFVNNKFNILSNFLLYYSYCEKNIFSVVEIITYYYARKMHFKNFLEENTLLDPDVDGRLLLKYIL